MQGILVALRELTPQSMEALAANNLRALKYIEELDSILFIPSQEVRQKPPRMPNDSAGTE